MSSLITRGSLFDDFFKDFAPGFYVRPLHGDALPEASQIKIDVKDLVPVSFADTKKMQIGNWLASAGDKSDAIAVGIVSHGTRPLTFPDDIILNANRGFLGIMPVDEKDKDGNVIAAEEPTRDPLRDAAGKLVQADPEPAPAEEPNTTERT